MFDRFTPRASMVMVFAQTEAKDLGHDYVGTGHLLLGLIHEGEGVAAQALQRLRFNLDDVRIAVAEIVPATGAVPQHLSLSIRARRVLERAAQEAAALGVNYIGTEHILLALFSEGPRDGEPAGTAWKIFADHSTQEDWCEWAREIVLIDFLNLALADEN